MDAMVALVILSATLVLSLSGLQAASRLAGMAEEAERVSGLARQLLVRGGDGVSEAAGRSGALRWTLERAQATGGVCSQRLQVWSLRTARTYDFRSAKPC